MSFYLSPGRIFQASIPFTKHSFVIAVNVNGPFPAGAVSAQFYLIEPKQSTGLNKLWQPGSLAARKWRENKKMKRKWRENEEMERE